MNETSAKLLTAWHVSSKYTIRIGSLSPMPEDYTLADLTRITGAKRRSVQLWAEAGVIRAKRETERRGTGTHRRFTRDEAVIACIVHAFARQQMAIGTLLEISQVMRRWVREMPGRVHVEYAIAGERKFFMIYQTCDDGSEVSIMEQRAGEASVTFAVDGADKEGGFVTVILLNNYLAGLR
jgi:hypothetical protein